MLCFVSLVGSKVGAEWPLQDEEEETGSQEFESFFPCAVAAVRPASCCCSDDATGAIQTTVLWRWRAPSDHGGCHANWRLATETAGRSKLRVVLCRQTHHMRSSARRPPVARQRRTQLRCRGARAARPGPGDAQRLRLDERAKGSCHLPERFSFCGPPLIGTGRARFFLLVQQHRTASFTRRLGCRHAWRSASHQVTS